MNSTIPDQSGNQRVVVESVRPSIDEGKFPIKRTIGEKVVVQADVFADGHDAVTAALGHRKIRTQKWIYTEMKFLGNDRWEGEFVPEELSDYEYIVTGWIDHFKTWTGDIRKKYEADQDIRVDLLIGALFIEHAIEKSAGEDRKILKNYQKAIRDHSDVVKAYDIAISQELAEVMHRHPDTSSGGTSERVYRVHVDRPRAVFSAWYEIFPRSCSGDAGRHGTFKDLETLLPDIAGMGFDVLYLPPIHPIGRTFRKGKNNSLVAEQNDPGSPWAIGSEEGGHKSIHPELGEMRDFKRLMRKAEELGMEIALDIAYQCTPDHPYVVDHPEWFRKRPDGSIQYAENPPKKYQDIYPFNFETAAWKALWEELKSIIDFWIEQGVKIFRVDNPHTKSFGFWEWLIADVRERHPDAIFLSEAFTRPKVMYRLAKIGFTQSYTYFTWRNTKQEFTDYLNELTKTEVREFFRPNFWPNTPDILPQHLQFDGRQEFIKRFILASTLSSNYGIYGPAFELCINEAFPGKEEYLDSEKYEIKQWDRTQPGNLRELIARVNRIRKSNPALQSTHTIEFHTVDNEQIICYDKMTDDGSNIILVVVNMDPHHTQSGWVKLPMQKFSLSPDTPFHVHDLLSNEKYIWKGESNFIELNPDKSPAHILKIHGRLMNETDFDYFF